MWGLVFLCSSVWDGPCLELVVPLGDHSPIAGALRGGKHILNHVAYRTSDLTAAGERQRAQGCLAAGDAKAAVAYGGKRVQFWISPLRFMIELVEAPEHRYAFGTAGNSGEHVH